MYVCLYEEVSGLR